MPAPIDTNPGKSALDLSDIVPFADFCREAEKRKLATRTALQWWMRYRRENGLLSSGAVVEKRANPQSKRALLFVVRPRFVEWLTNSHQHAA
ncbi:hypothetical protein HW932_09620 [Allochromatium humboldtianum]|uniref:Uncharacterized protein n=1 Tax=Allochromatium humboldtianum TaxID=504901 RepID=A0A850RIV7_9GAMM|nr:hypothetical protein [Allochromatium humboldtianum]NVZ09521.1 hypothetical protein [Allochromatium humboldtianum]